MDKYDYRSWAQKHKRELVIAVLIFVLLTLYLGGMISQSSGVRFGNESESFSFSPFVCIMANFTYGPTGLISLLVIYAVIGVLLYQRLKDRGKFKTEKDTRGFKRELNGAHGTSKLMTPEEATSYCEVEPLQMTTGTILGKFSDEVKNKKTSPENRAAQKEKIISLPPDSCRWAKTDRGTYLIKKNEYGERRYVREPILNRVPNMHIMAVGSSGSGKSHNFVLPNIIQSIRQRCSVAVTDPKGELYALTSNYAREHGYTVKVLNLDNPRVSDSWDAVGELKDSPQIDIDAQKFCEIIIQNTSKPESHGDPIYENGEMQLLYALVLYICTSPSYSGPKTLGAILDLLEKYDDDEMQARIYSDNTNLARGPWALYRQGPDKLRSSFRGGLAIRLLPLLNDTLKYVTGVPDIDLELPGKAPCIYYIIINPLYNPYSFVSSLFFSSMFDRLWKYAGSRPKRRLEVPVNFYLDEFIAIGKIPKFENALATVRSIGVNLAIIFQDLPQLKAAYPNDHWQSLVSNCNAFLCLGCNDNMTAKYFSERSGTMTVVTDNYSMDEPKYNLFKVDETKTHSVSTSARPVLFPDEVLTLCKDGGKEKVIIALANANLIVADKYPYTAMISTDELKEESVDNHVPAWRMEVAKYTVPAKEENPDLSYKQKYNLPEPASNDGSDENSENEAIKFGNGTKSEVPSLANTVQDSPKKNVDTQSDDDFDEDISSAPAATQEDAPKKKRNGMTRVTSSNGADLGYF